MGGGLVQAGWEPYNAEDGRTHPVLADIDGDGSDEILVSFFGEGQGRIRVFDPVNVGFVSDMAEENGRSYFEFDVSLPSNSNGGHLYGTELSDEEKDAIVEYMKTL